MLQRWLLRAQKSMTLAAVVGLLALSVASGSNQNHAGEVSTEVNPEGRYAYVTIHYEGTPADAEYVLGIRVLLQSLKPLRYPFIILVSDSVTQASRDLFASEGATIVDVANVDNPYGHVLSRFLFTFNKLHLWNMTQFDRIIYFDADNIAIHRELVDQMFHCGHFCVLYMNPCHFHTGVMVVKPDREKYDELLRGLHNINSYDGADQGFLSAFFEACADAPMFDPAHGISEEPLNQLHISYNMHALYYLARYDFEPYRCGPFQNTPGLPVATLGFPVPPVIKPWYWWTTLFGHTAQWDAIRSQLHEPGLITSFLGRLFFAVFLFFAASYGLHTTVLRAGGGGGIASGLSGKDGAGVSVGKVGGGGGGVGGGSVGGAAAVGVSGGAGGGRSGSSGGGALMDKLHVVMQRMGPQLTAFVLGVVCLLLCYSVCFRFVPYTFKPWMGITLYITCHLSMLLLLARLIGALVLLHPATATDPVVPVSELVHPLVAFLFLFGAEWIDPALSSVIGPGLHIKIVTLTVGFVSVVATQVNLFVHLAHTSPLFPLH